MREREIEAKLGRELKNLGCIYYKFVSPGNAGVPDRIVITPKGSIFFVELKRDDGVVSRQQAFQIRRLKKCHQKVRVVFGMEDVKKLVGEIRKETGRNGVHTARISEAGNTDDT